MASLASVENMATAMIAHPYSPPSTAPATVYHSTLRQKTPQSNLHGDGSASCRVVITPSWVRLWTGRWCSCRCR